MEDRGSAYLDGDVGSSTVDTEGLIATPRDADMVEDHILALCDASCILATRASLAHANADVAYDGVVGVREGPAVAVYCDALSWCSLTEDTDAFGDYNALFDLDETANLEDNDAVRL
jgi:hypothetical protein